MIRAAFVSLSFACFAISTALAAAAPEQICRQALNPAFESMQFKAMRAALALRYKVEIRGVEKVAIRGRSKILFLFNHPGFTDPPLVMSQLGPIFSPRPVIDAGQKDIPLIGKWLHQAGHKINAIWVPRPGRDASVTEEMQRVMDDVVAALRAGDNVLLYPSGQLMRTNREVLGNKKMLEYVVKAVPDARIVLGRTIGHWGSSFGAGAKGRLDLPSGLVKASTAVVANGVFFIPKRPITMELFEPDDFPRDSHRRVMNQFVEEYFNAVPHENLHVPYHFWNRLGPSTR